MKFVLLLFAIGLIKSAISAPISRAVYGEDNRIDVTELGDPAISELGKSVAGFVQNHRLSEMENGNFSFKQFRVGLCDGENFKAQYTLPTCSAFLIAPKLLLTAGHCVTKSDFCLGNKIVFDFNENVALSGKLESSKVFECERVVLFIKTRELDYGIIELKRDATGRIPLKLQSEKIISDDEGLFVLGHPSGLPLKYADNAEVAINKHPSYFKTNLDTFAGNSGSPVFNSKTHEVEGILVGGDEDYELDRYKGCLKTVSCNKLGDYGCIGETVTRISAILELKNI